MGRAPESPGGGRVRGRRAAGTPSRAARRLGGRARAARWGRGAEGARRKGEGSPAVPRPRALPVLAPGPRCLPSVAGLLPPPRGPRSEEPEDLRARGGCGLRSRPPAGLGACPRRKGRWLARGAGAGGVALAFARGWRSAARARLPSPGSPRPRTGRPRGARPQVGPPRRAGTAPTFLDLTVEWGDSTIVRQTHSSHGKMQVMSEKAGVDPQKVVCSLWTDG